MNSSPEIVQIPALKDNYIYLFRTPKNQIWVVDPTLAKPVMAYCESQGLPLSGVLVTHHHPDHTGGIAELVSKYKCPVWGYANDTYRIPEIEITLPAKGSAEIDGLEVQYFATPGHTLGHICYYFPQLTAVFCGDTMFSFGCGRLFEGTAAQMVNSLSQIRALPSHTYFYCSHEYTQVNIEFALSLEPDNEGLRAQYEIILQKRERQEPTIPDLLETQKRFNPFLRWDDQAFKTKMNMRGMNDVDFFAEIRRRRNRF